jgi:MFS transporter, putative metabolite:H+ symporter
VAQADGIRLYGKHTIAARLDRLPVTALHIAILAVCAMGLFADIAELVLSNAFSAILLAPPYNVAHGELSLLLASVFAGGAIGAPALGWFADRYGRRTALQLSLAILAASSLAAASTRDIAVLTGFRFVSGIAIGAYPPLAIAYLSDILPPKRRGMLILFSASLACLGAPAMILLIRWLTPIAPWGIEGWRWALILGGLLSAAAGILYGFLPESPRWLAALGYGAKADLACRRFEAAADVASPSGGAPQLSPARAASGLRMLVRDRENLKRAAMLVALHVFGPWATVGFPVLSAAVMLQKGFHLSDSLFFAGITAFGPALGNGIAAVVIDRLERRMALALCAGVMMAAGILFAVNTELTLLIVVGTVFTLTIAVFNTVLNIYGSELFSTDLRASATAGAWAVSRVVSACVPLVLLPLLGIYGTLSMFVIVAAAMLASLTLLLLAAPPGLAGRPVE